MFHDGSDQWSCKAVDSATVGLRGRYAASLCRPKIIYSVWHSGKLGSFLPQYSYAMLSYMTAALFRF